MRLHPLRTLLAFSLPLLPVLTFAAPAPADYYCCIRSVVTCATGDGKLLLNVGLTPAGVIEPRQAELLREAGTCIARHGHSIYGTRGGPCENAKWGGATRRGKSIFGHVFDWKGGEILQLLPLQQKVVSARVLTGRTVTFKQASSGIDLTVPITRASTP